MKRNVNDFEKQLLEKGWVLDSKKYYGKDSKSILCYTYRKEICFDIYSSVSCFIDYKKKENRVINVYIENFACKIGGFVSFDDYKEIESIFAIVNDEIDSCFGETNE